MNYPKLQELLPDGQIYENTHMNTLEAFLPTGGFDTAHGPGLLEAENGDLICVWFAGSFEGNADIHIVSSRLPKGSDRWEPVVDVSNDPHRSEQNPSLFQHPNGEIWALYTAQLDRVEGKDNMQFTSIVRRQTTRDFGRTWEEPVVLFPEEGTFCRQPIQILSNGRWIMGNWICTDSAYGLAGDPTASRISDDEGKTWRRVDMPRSNGRVHANVVELENGNLVAFMRSRAADNIYISHSHDFGETWSEPKPTSLPNNNSSISAVKLQSGRIAITYNPTHAPNADPNGSMATCWYGTMHPELYAAISPWNSPLVSFEEKLLEEGWEMPVFAINGDLDHKMDIPRKSYAKLFETYIRLNGACREGRRFPCSGIGSAMPSGTGKIAIPPRRATARVGG